MRGSISRAHAYLAKLIRDRFSLRRRLLLILLISSVPGMIVAVFLAANALHNERIQIETHAKRLADIQEAQHAAVIQNARILLDTTVEMLAMRNLSDADCARFLDNWLDRYLSFTSLTLFDARGNVVCENEETLLPNGFPDDDFVEDVREAGSFMVGDYVLGRSDMSLIIAARPVLSPAGNFIGGAAVGIDLRWLEFLARRMDLPAGSTITALGSEGKVLNHYRAEALGDNDVAAPVETLPAPGYRSEIAALGSGVLYGETMTGNRRVYGFQRTSDGNLTIVIGQPEYLEFERYGAALRDTLAAPLTILLLALAAAAYASEALVTRWVQRLTDAAKQMASGDLEVRSNVPHSRYEIGRLAAAFDSMVSVIRQSQREIHQRAEQYRNLLSELNHRVNNNLQIIRSLIRMRTRQLNDIQAQATLADIDERIGSLAEIQRMLYNDEGSDAGDRYIERFARFLHRFYASDSITIVTDMQPLRLPRRTLVPLGLIINELVANSRKHAFPAGRRGEIAVHLRAQNGQMLLTVADDGVDLAEDPRAARRSGSIGLGIIETLVQQIDGKLTVEPRSPGKAFHVSFPVTAPGEERASG